MCKRITAGVEERGKAMIDEGRARIGVVMGWFNGDGGYDYIFPEKGGEAVFMHHTCIEPRAKARSLEKGAQVSYEVTQEKMAGLWARNVCLTEW